MSVFFRSAIFLAGFWAVCSSEAFSQCTSCDGKVEVTFRGAMCANGTFEVQLHDKTIGPVAGQGCGTYTPSPDGKVKLEPDVEYTMSISGSAVSTAHMEIDVPSCFKVYIDGEEKNTVDESGFGCTQYTGTWTVVLKSGGAGGSGSGGDGDLSAGSSSGGVGGSFSLGGSASGSAGSISFSSGTISPDIFTPSVLNYVSLSPEIEVIRDPVTNHLRQVKAVEVLADIVVLSSTSYEIRFYPIGQVGAKVAGLYQSSGNPSRVWRFSPQNPPSLAELKVTEVLGSIQNERVFSQIDGVWTSTIPGIRSETRMESTLPNGDSQIETTIIHPTTGLVVSKKREIFHAFPWGTQKISSIVDPDGEALATTWFYYEDAADVTNYSRLKWVIDPDGSWQRYDYRGIGQSAGKVHHVYRPWKNSPASPSDATTTNCHLTTYYYSSPSYAYFQTEVSWVGVKVLGVTVGREDFYPYLEYVGSWHFPVLTDYPEMEYLPVISRQSPGKETATFDTTSEVPEYLRGKLAYVEHGDGRQEVHAYEKGDYDGATGTFNPLSTGTHLRESIFQVSSTNPFGVSGKSLKTVKITSPAGNLLKEELLVKTTSDYASLKTTTHGYDPEGRHVLTHENGRVTYEASWLNGRQVSETDEQGITTTFDVYNAEGQVTQETRLGIVTTRTYDPMDRLTATTRSAGGLSATTSTSYDIAGRMVSVTSEDGLVTGTTYSNGGRTITRTSADASTEITNRYLDGQTESITGTGVVARYFDYGTDSNGLWNKESIGSAISSRYSQSWRSLNGQTWLAAVSGPTEPIYTQTEFDPYIDDRVVSRTVPGEAKILFSYDPETGALLRQARDLNANGVIDEDSDAIQGTDISYVEDAGNWFRQTWNIRYETDGNATPSTQSIIREQLTGLGSGIASATKFIDSQGHVTSRTTAIDRSTRTVIVTTDVPDSTLNAVETTVDGLLRSVTTSTVAAPVLYSGYDALGRPTQVTSPRGAVTTTAYNPTTGRVSSVTAAGKTTSYTYHPAGETGAGRIATETLPDNTVIRTSYTPRGEVFRVWGGATYPLERTYDGYGQLQYLKTYRGGMGWSGDAWLVSPGTADVTEWSYHESTGSIHQKIDAAAHATACTYDAASGKLLTFQRARGPVTTYTWSALGLVESVTYSDGTPSVTHTYDRAGRPKTRRMPQACTRSAIRTR